MFTQQLFTFLSVNAQLKSRSPNKLRKKLSIIYHITKPPILLKFDIN